MLSGRHIAKQTTRYPFPWTSNSKKIHVFVDHPPVYKICLNNASYVAPQPPQYIIRQRDSYFSSATWLLDRKFDVPSPFSRKLSFIIISFFLRNTIFNIHRQTSTSYSRSLSPVSFWGTHRPHHNITIWIILLCIRLQSANRVCMYSLDFGSILFPPTSSTLALCAPTNSASRPHPMKKPIPN